MCEMVAGQCVGQVSTDNIGGQQRCSHHEDKGHALKPKA